jgi:hypothetical protein
MSGYTGKGRPFAPREGGGRDLGTRSKPWGESHVAKRVVGDGDEIVIESGGALTLEDGAELDFESMSNGDPGAGISDGSDTIFKTSVVRIGDIFKTSILIDLTDLKSSTTLGDIIGTGTDPAYLGQITAAKNGTILGGIMTCLEAPATGVDDIDLYAAEEATGDYDEAISGLTESALLTAGGAWSAGDIKVLSAMPAADDYLYLAGGDNGTADTYTAGKFLIELYGYKA